MKIYISIPISSHDVMTQTGTALLMAEKIKALGHEPVNPFETPLAPPEWPERQKYAYYMGRDIEKLLLCDAIYFCEGWHESKGCRVESYIAETYGIKRYLDLRFIPKTK